MFQLLLMSASALLHGYVFWRLRTIPFVVRAISRRVYWGSAGAFWLVTLLAHPAGHADLGLFSQIVEGFGLYWLGILFIVFTTMLATDLVTGFGHLLPRVAIRLRVVALAVACGLIGLALYLGTSAPVVESYDLRLSKLPDTENGSVIVVLSDLHLGKTLSSDWLLLCAREVAVLKPDYLFLIGDILEGHGSAEEGEKLLPALSQLRAKKGVYVVPGNHERYAADESGLQLFKDAGFRLLQDSWVEAAPGLVVAGIDDPTLRAAKRDERNPFPNILAGKPANALTILLSHRPDLVLEAASSGVDVMLSGHTHGGQIWPFGILTQLVFPYLEGRYEAGGTTLFVSRGTGTWGPRMRLFRPGEILLVRLLKALPN